MPNFASASRPTIDPETDPAVAQVHFTFRSQTPYRSPSSQPTTLQHSLILHLPTAHHTIVFKFNTLDALFTTMASISAKIATIEAVESVIQYKFNHSALLWEALQCPGSPDAKHPNGNKRLAIIGDTVLLLGLAEDWFMGNETIGMNQDPRPNQHQ